ncbi:MAG TPA: EFR1 family ferrodoxin [Bacillota bacterium]|nr:EFR1 family ferrodoxin [Bacillota bacterium]
MKIFYFTSTGNSLYVAKKIGGELYSIPRVLKEGTREFAAEAIGFVFPCYFFGLPRIVAEFMEKTKFQANYSFAIITCGKMTAASLNQLEELGAKAGLKFDYTDQIAMIDNYLPLFNENQLRTEPGKNIEGCLEKIVRDIQSRKTSLTRKGLATRTMSRAFHFFYNFGLDNKDEKFIVHDTCNGCQICEKVCPKNNILVNGKPEFLHSCDSCYACAHHCPQNAIHHKSERSKLRFINQNITLKEIIDSNN